jgi:hypothetical protein
MSGFTLELAIARKDWDLVARCLLAALVDTLKLLSRETVEELLDLLELEDDR